MGDSCGIDDHFRLYYILKKCIATENHPAILIDWQLEVDEPFVVVLQPQEFFINTLQ
jgi:hypothetical protein